MTREREEAIEILQNTSFFGRSADDIDTAINMAIKELEQEPSPDMISKQAVDALIDELARAISDEECGISRGRSTATIMRDIRHLPPVTPEHMEFEHKTGVVIAQLREDRDKLLDVIAQITEEINTPNRGTCDYAIVDNIEEIINDYKALDKDDSIEDFER